MLIAVKAAAFAALILLFFILAGGHILDVLEIPLPAYPLAVPSIASPGAMLAAVLLKEKDVYSIPEQALTTLAMFTVIIIALIFMFGANLILRLVGNSGTSIISRLMGLILASAAVANILAGFEEYFSI